MQHSIPQRCLPIVVLLYLIGPASALAQSSTASLFDRMPRVGDHASMWWVDGFPPRVAGAPWHRCIQTGQYAIVLDTETITIPHFGLLPPSVGYSSQRLDESVLRSLPSADLGLGITVDGKSYRCTSGGPWSRFSGPRLIESGRFFQRGDVTDLVFTADDGTILSVEARFEMAAWPDRLAMILAARPGLRPISSGEPCFGRVHGGFGLDGTNHLEIPHRPELDPQKFTLELWAFVPDGYRATKASPWLVCKNHHEQAEGNFGILIVGDGVPQARMNIGGGRQNAFVSEPKSKQSLKMNAWNHLAISYDGETLRLYANGSLAGDKFIGRQRVPLPGGLAFGRRQDNSGDGYHFRGVVDEIRLYDRVLSLNELRLRYRSPEIERPALQPVGEWTFDSQAKASMSQPSEQWQDAAMHINLITEKGELRERWELPKGQSWSSPQWHQVSLAMDPVAFQVVDPTSAITVQASEFAGGASRPVEYDGVLGWHRINLDGIEPTVVTDDAKPSNDAIERVKLVLSNRSDREQVARLMFEKTARGFRQRIGTPITGLSAILRDRDGYPTGIPVQLSKNWHNHAQGGVYAGQWFHGISQLRLPANTTTELELTLAYGHWGGVPAASHAQLSLIGWGSNQQWDQSAIGSWGESICYEPDQVQASCAITDVRPMLVRSKGNGGPWGWTNNVGGGDFFRCFDRPGQRVPHSAMRTTYHRQGPCLTEVTYAGRIGEGMTHAATVSLARCDDLVRGVYQIRLDVHQATDFSRLVIFQIGADTYSSTAERKMALGNVRGLIREWNTQWGGDTYRMQPMECAGHMPWASLHEAEPREQEKQGAWANRGIVIRQWKARLGGQDAAPWMAERGIKSRSRNSSTLDILPPPQVTRLEAGDFVEATIEHIVMPQFAQDYYGPSETLRAALIRFENTWRMIHREAVGNDRKVKMLSGTLKRLYPDVSILTSGDEARLQVAGGLGYLPITFSGLSSSRDYELLIDGNRVNQSIHGNDFWQTDWDPATETWSQTYNLPVLDGKVHTIDFRREQ